MAPSPQYPTEDLPLFFVRTLNLTDDGRWQLRWIQVFLILSLSL